MDRYNTLEEMQEIIEAALESKTIECQPIRFGGAGSIKLDEEEGWVRVVIKPFSLFNFKSTFYRVKELPAALYFYEIKTNTSDKTALSRGYPNEGVMKAFVKASDVSPTRYLKLVEDLEWEGRHID